MRGHRHPVLVRRKFEELHTLGPTEQTATAMGYFWRLFDIEDELLFGSPAGGQSAAIFYTLTATCRRLKIDPYAYLKDVFERLPILMRNSADPDVPTLLVPLLPDHWLAEHPESQLQIRTNEANTKSAARRSRRTRRRQTLDRTNQNRQ